jgi:hypothetical protein
MLMDMPDEDGLVSALEPRPSPARPLSVTLLAFGVLTIAGLHLMRGIQALMQWEVIAALLPGLQVYLTLSGFLWASIGFPLAWGLWRGDNRAPRLLGWVALAYTVYFWLDRLLLRQGLEPANLPFAFGLTVVLLFFTFWTLSRTRARRFFMGRDA